MMPGHYVKIQENNYNNSVGVIELNKVEKDNNFSENAASFKQLVKPGTQKKVLKCS
jgi:hypothetical protein